MFHAKKVQIRSDSHEIHTNFVRNSWQPTLKCSGKSCEFVTNSHELLRISCEFHMNLTEISHLVHRDHRVLRKTLPVSIGFPPHTMGRGDEARPQKPFHLVGDCTRRRRLQDLQQVVSRELEAPFTVKYLPDTWQIVLTPERRVTRTVQPGPGMEERMIMAVWRIRSLHLSKEEARYLVGSMTYGVVWKHVNAMLRQLASPESWAFTAYTADDTAIHGAACYLPDRIGHL